MPKGVLTDEAATIQFQMLTTLDTTLTFSDGHILQACVVNGKQGTFTTK
jgi:hypothetical protein